LPHRGFLGVSGSGAGACGADFAPQAELREMVKPLKNWAKFAA
jgi:hypothetical protein